ncbi:MAG: DUF3244 domain-containing protein [Bacteroidales bacterium]
MKTLIVTAALVVLTTLSFSQNAKESSATSEKENLNVEFISKSANTLTMKVDKDSTVNLAVKVRDAEGNMLSQNWIKKTDSKTLTFDISNLPAGEYTFEVIKRNKILYSKQVSKSDGIIAMSE